MINVSDLAAGLDPSIDLAELLAELDALDRDWGPPKGLLADSTEPAAIRDARHAQADKARRKAIVEEEWKQANGWYEPGADVHLGEQRAWREANGHRWVTMAEIREAHGWEDLVSRRG